MRVRFTPRAANELRRAAPQPKKRIRDALRRLAQDPSGRKHGLDIKVLDSDHEPPLQRLRIGDWRVSYFLYQQDLRVVHVKRRGEGYGWVADAGLDAWDP